MWRIKNWDETFENNQSRNLKTMTWVKVPTKMDGDGYTELLDHPNGATHYGAWMACTLIAAKCNPRGTLVRTGNKPHDFDSLARISRIPCKVFEEAIPRLVSIGWLEDIPVDTKEVNCSQQEHASRTHEGALETHRSAISLLSSSSCKSNKKKKTVSEEVRSVYAHYREHHPRCPEVIRSTSKEWRAIKDRLEDGFSVDSLCQAIDGCHKTPHNLGKNDRGQKYLALELIMRTSGHVTRFIEAFDEPAAGTAEQKPLNLDFDPEKDGIV
jgi:hypothetical protein